MQDTYNSPPYPTHVYSRLSRLPRVHPAVWAQLTEAEQADVSGTIVYCDADTGEELHRAPIGRRDSSPVSASAAALAYDLDSVGRTPLPAEAQEVGSPRANRRRVLPPPADASADEQAAYALAAYYADAEAADEAAAFAALAETLPANRAGLSTAHNSPHLSKRHLNGCDTVTVWRDGSYLQVKRSYTVESKSGGGKRGRISRFSRQSAKRMKDKLGKIRRDDMPHFVTLTWPDVWEWDGAAVKSAIDRLGKRFKRRYPRGGFIWKLEVKRRKSGTSKGEPMPHLHLLVWGVGRSAASTEVLRHWITDTWPDTLGVTDSESIERLRAELNPKSHAKGTNRELHRRAGTKVERIRSHRGVMSYASKYMSKQEEMDVSEGIGRFWGVIGKKNIPWSSWVTYRGASGAKAIMRIIQRLRDIPHLPESLGHFGDGSEWDRRCRVVFGGDIGVETGVG